jgi:uncharacterized membrane protein
MRTEATTAGSAYRREGDAWLIELKLREIRQLFHHLDPAPFHEKDLDPAAEAYILEAIREIGTNRRIKLVVYLPEAQARLEEARTVPQAIEHYFAYRVRQTQLELRQLLRRATTNLVIGLAFLFACLSLRSSLESRAGPGLLTEGLLIIGWVALWRPVENYLYDWWPIVRRTRRLDAARRMSVDVVPTAD